MLCQQCKKETASVHVIHLVNGQSTERHLCESCARKDSLAMSEDLLHNFSVSLLSSLIEMQLGGDKESIRTIETATSCPRCGQTYRQLQRTGRLGCSVCYQTYRQHLDPLFRRVHGSDTHRGKIPERGGETIKLQKRLSDLRKEMQQAVLDERFEAAARLRDEVRLLEGKES